MMNWERGSASTLELGLKTALCMSMGLGLLAELEVSLRREAPMIDLV
jgi:hypothetical protein